MGTEVNPTNMVSKVTIAPLFYAAHNAMPSMFRNVLSCTKSLSEQNIIAVFVYPDRFATQAVFPSDQFEYH